MKLNQIIDSVTDFSEKLGLSPIQVVDAFLYQSKITVGNENDFVHMISRCCPSLSADMQDKLKARISEEFKEGDKVHYILSDELDAYKFDFPVTDTLNLYFF